MKQLKNLPLLLLLALCIACGGGQGHNHETSSGDTLSAEEKRLTKEYGSAYVCPMHCKGSGSDQPGKCPVCKMDYVANPDFKTETHDHNHDHEGHDHEGHDHN